MSNSQRRTTSDLYQRFCYILLAFFWFAGLLSGTVQALCSSENLNVYFRTANYCSLSWTGLLLSIFLPLSFCIFSVHLSKAFLILPVIFLKAYSFSHCVLSILWTFGSAGWLVCSCLFFSDFAGILVLLWFSINHINGNRHQLLRNTLLSLISIIITALVQQLVFSPLFQNFMCRCT